MDDKEQERHASVGADEESIDTEHAGSIDKTVKVQSPIDKSKCLVTGMSMFDNGQIIMADFNNCSIKLASMNPQTLTQLHLSLDKELNAIDLPVRPWGVAVTNGNEAVATIPDIGRLQFVTVVDDGKIIKGRLLATEKECSGIGYAREKLFVSYTYRPCVRILTLDGGIVRRVTCDSLGQKLFNNPLFLFACKRTGTVYVSDRRSRSVISLDTEGAVLNNHTIDDAQPYDVTADMQGNVYVCMKLCPEIRRLAIDHRDDITLLSRRHLMGTPSAICFDNRNKQLVVTFDGLKKAAIYKTCDT